MNSQQENIDAGLPIRHIRLTPLQMMTPHLHHPQFQPQPQQLQPQPLLNMALTPRQILPLQPQHAHVFNQIVSKTRSRKRLAIAAGLPIRHQWLSPIPRPRHPILPIQQPQPQPQPQPPINLHHHIGTLTRSGKRMAIAAGLPVRHQCLPPTHRTRHPIQPQAAVKVLPWIGAKTRSRKRLAHAAGLNILHKTLNTFRRPRTIHPQQHPQPQQQPLPEHEPEPEPEPEPDPDQLELPAADEIDDFDSHRCLNNMYDICNQMNQDCELTTEEMAAALAAAPPAPPGLFDQIADDVPDAAAFVDVEAEQVCF